jgi:putative DNA primase/helicase
MLLHSIHKPSVTLIPADTITPVAYDWVWKEWLARGALHLLAGKPGTGKTTLALKLATHVSTGADWPDGSPCSQGDVVIWSGEDSLQHTLVPRLAASGAYMQRVQIVGDLPGTGGNEPFNPAKHMPNLAVALEKHPGTRLLIIDPLVSVLSGDGNKNTDVRRDLDPLVKLATDRHLAVLGITHFNKASEDRAILDRVMGSVAFAAVCRLVMATVLDIDENRNLVRIKSNIGPDAGGFLYDLMEKPVPRETDMHAHVVEWLGEATEDARAMAGSAPHMNPTKIQLATKLIEALLQDGPLPQSTIQNAVKAVNPAFPG